MPLPPDFRFSQNNLQDFVDCERRFELRYLLKIKYPAPLTEPVIEAERRMLQGQRFHRMVQQFMLNVPAASIAIPAGDNDLLLWWQNFQQSLPEMELPAQHHAEVMLSAPFSSFRLMAKIDLLAIQPGSLCTILDWKTSQRRTSRRRLQDRLQTRLYPFLACLAGSHLNQGNRFLPEQIEMIYWFAEFADEPERFSYSPDQFAADEVYLSTLILRVQAKHPGEFLLTLNEQACLFCNYRSLCNRGEKAGDFSLQEAEDPAETTADLDFDQVAELEF